MISVAPVMPYLVRSSFAIIKNLFHMIYFNKLIQLQRGCCGFSHLHPTFCDFIIHDPRPKINKKILIFCGQFLYISAEKRHDCSLSGCPDGQYVPGAVGFVTSLTRSVSFLPWSNYSLSGCPDGQYVTDCPGQIAALGPLDRSLVSARPTEFVSRYRPCGGQITVYRSVPKPSP